MRGRCLSYAISSTRTVALILAIAIVVIATNSAPRTVQALEKLRAAYPAVAKGLAPLWVTAEKGIWQRYGFDVETILMSGGARAVPALVSNSGQFLFGADTGVTTAILQGIPLVRVGVTLNSLGSSLLIVPGIQSVQDLKGKTLGISRGRDASYARLAKLLRDNGLDPNSDFKSLPIGGGEGGRLAAVKASTLPNFSLGRIQAFLYNPP